MVGKTDVSFFNFSLMDTSSISIFDLGSHFTNYHIDVTRNMIYNYNDGMCRIVISWNQSRE